MRTLAKCFALSAVLLTGGFTTSSFAGPEPMESKDKVMMAPPPVCDPRWYISIGGSADFHFGDFSDGVNESAFGVPVTVDSRDWNDVYDIGWNVQGEIGYVVTDHIEVFAGLRYQRAESSTFLQEDAISRFGENFEFRWGDYESIGGELGVRYFFLSKEKKLRPFISLAAGASSVSDIGLRVEGIGGVGPIPVSYNGAFYDGGVVPTATALFGVEYNMTCHFAVRADAGIRWESGLDQNDRDFGAFDPGSTEREVIRTLRFMNDAEGDHLTVPVTLSAIFRF